MATYDAMKKDRPAATPRRNEVKAGKTVLTRRHMLACLATLPLALSATGEADAQNADCSAAVRRVLARTNGQLLSVSVTQSGGRPMCRITVLASDGGGERRRRVTVNERP